MSNVICSCAGVTEEDIIKAVKNGATTFEAVGEATEAGTICGVCEDDVKKIIEENK